MSSIPLGAEYEKFLKISKLMNKSEISTNHDTLCGYREKIIVAYNAFVSFICDNYSDVGGKDQALLDEYLKKVREIFTRCLDRLRCTFTLPDDIYVQVDPISIGAIPTEDSDSDSDPETGEMAALTSIDILNLVNRHFPQKFSGDPLGLTSFLDGIRILRRFATTPALQADLHEFLLSKLDKKAREAVTDDIDTLDKLVDILKSTIKPDDSTIIEGRIAALRYSYAKEDEFMVKAEELAEALHRTLIIEGVTPDKANKMTISSTIALCRRSTTSAIVKSALISKPFATPKEVIATLVVENGACVKEQQILSVQKLNREKRNNSQNHGKGHNGRNKNHSNNSNGSNQNGGQNRQQYQNKNRNGQRQQNKGNGGNSYGNNGQRSNSNQNYQNYQQYPSQNVRLVNSGNGAGPQQMNLGAQQTAQMSGPFQY